MKEENGKKNIEIDIKPNDVPISCHFFRYCYTIGDKMR